MSFPWKPNAEVISVSCVSRTFEVRIAPTQCKLSPSGKGLFVASIARGAKRRISDGLPNSMQEAYTLNRLGQVVTILNFIFERYLVRFSAALTSILIEDWRCFPLSTSKPGLL
jgi:hypothetical protein